MLLLLLLLLLLLMVVMIMMIVVMVMVGAHVVVYGSDCRSLPYSIHFSEFTPIFFFTRNEKKTRKYSKFIRKWPPTVTRSALILIELLQAVTNKAQKTLGFYCIPHATVVLAVEYALTWSVTIFPPPSPPSLGVMRLSDLSHIFRSENFPANLMKQYINLLSKFEVALRWSSEYLLVPSLLPYKQQDTNQPVPTGVSPLVTRAMNMAAYIKNRVLRRQYVMSYVPSGFWPRLITRLECLFLSLEFSDLIIYFLS